MSRRRRSDTIEVSTAEKREAWLFGLCRSVAIACDEWALRQGIKVAVRPQAGRRAPSGTHSRKIDSKPASTHLDGTQQDGSTATDTERNHRANASHAKCFTSR